MAKQPNTIEPNAKRSRLQPKDRRKKAVKDGAPSGALQADIDRNRALSLREAGVSFRKIAEQIGVSVETAHRYVNDAWERINQDSDKKREMLRDIQEERIDMGLRVVIPLLTLENLVVVTTDSKGHEIRMDAADLRLKAVDRMAKLVTCLNQMRGLNAPTKIEDVTPPRRTIPLEELARSVMEGQARATPEERRRRFEQEEREIAAFQAKEQAKKQTPPGK